MRIAGITYNSTVNGPGERTVIHFQGCKFNCVGCFNSDTHDLYGGIEIDWSDLIRQIPINPTGITISGGEPFLQQEELLRFVEFLSAFGYDIVVFSGFYKHEILKLKLGKEILKHIDVLIDGRFDESLVTRGWLHGSDNQTIHLITDRYALEDFKKRDVEFTFNEKGEVSITGFPTNELLNEVKL